jgi:hypothetical protein
MQSCGIFFRQGIIFVTSTSFDECGIGYDAGPRFKVTNHNEGEIGRTVISALDFSRTGIPSLDRYEVKQKQKELYSFLGVKSWAELMRSASYISIERRDSKTFINSYRVSKNGGFEPDGTSISCSSIDPEEIGREILKILKL